MKNLLKSLSFAILTLCAVASCKTKDVEPDYTGTYAVYTNSLQTAYGSPVTTTDVPSDVTIYKGAQEGELNIGTGDNKIILTMYGNTFRIFPQGWWNSGPNGSKYILSIIGDGAFSGNNLTLHFTSSSTDKAMNYSGVFTVRGTKK